MSQQYRLIQLPLIGTFLLCLVIGIYLFAAKRFAKPGSVVKHSVDTPADDVLKYWTADKLRNAKPAPMPNVDVPDRRKKSPRRPPRASDSQNS